MTEASTDIATQAVTSLDEKEFRHDFELGLELPDALKPLDDVSDNFYWSWQPEGAALFRDIDPNLWEACEQTPRALLKKVKQLRLWQLAADTAYLERLWTFEAKFREYVSSAHDSTDARIAYFCAEYGVHNSLPNYSGGLGILAGDHLKSASDLNVPLVAIGLLYRYGYFRQRIGHDGWQRDSYNDLFGGELALTPVVDETGARVTVGVRIRNREVSAQAWLAQIGRISLYLLDTHLPQNSEVDRLITGHLYGGDTETRIVQEKVLGIGGVRLLRKLGIEPEVYHLNEGHAAFSTLELAREHLASRENDNFADAVQAVRSKCVFTTHTPVAAGNDVFAPETLRECFSDEFIASLGLTTGEFLTLGRADLSDDSEAFGMTPLALRMCRSANGVSAKHGEVSRELWHKMYPEAADAAEVPITAVTNGVHPPTWIAPLFQSMYNSRVGLNWNEIARDAEAWKAAVDTLTDHEIWHSHRTMKELLISFIRGRTLAKSVGNRNTINERTDTSNLFSAEYLTIGFARRVAAYKRWDLLFTDIQRLLAMVDDAARPVQFVFAGKAHPQDKTAKGILQKLMSINHESNWQNRAAFIEDYDQEVARYLVQGVDVWMNVPRRPMEASGTSGMKAAMNGVLNASILDGWWIEGYNGRNGFGIGGLEPNVGEKATDEGMDEAKDVDEDHADAEALYSTLENDIIPTYYALNEDGLRGEWISRMRDAISALTPQFSSDRMMSDYLQRIYQLG